jgi:hypothetical protein
MHQPLDDHEVRARLASEIQNATGYLDDEITAAREQALEYYHGDEPAQPEEGRSSVVSTDVRDTIEWIKPQLMKMFGGSQGNIAEWQPMGPEDVDAAEQETDVVNYVFYHQNAGWYTLLEWFSDALLSKVGYVRCYYDNSNKQTTETYENLTDAELVMLMQDPEVEPIEHESFEVPTPQGVMLTHNIKLERTQSKGQVRVECVPPERILVARDATSLDPNEASFFAFYDRKSRTELLEMGLDPEQIDNLQQDDEEFRTGEEFTRKALNTSWWTQDNASEDHFWIFECYVRMDIDGDGRAKLWKFLVGGSGYEILDREEVDRVPFAALSPVPLSHQHYGLSIADLTVELQQIKTALLRQVQDNLYLANNPRTEAVTGMVNLDDLLTSRIGGVIRVKQPGMLREVTTPFVAAQSFPMLEYWDKVRGERTGASDEAMGLDANVLQNATAGAIAQANGRQAVDAADP